MAVTAEQVGDRVLGEAEPVVHAESVRRRPLRIVELDLLGDPGEQRTQTRDEIGSGLDDPLTLDRLERVPRRADHAGAAR